MIPSQLSGGIFFFLFLLLFFSFWVSSASREKQEESGFDWLVQLECSIPDWTRATDPLRLHLRLASLRFHRALVFRRIMAALVKTPNLESREPPSTIRAARALRSTGKNCDFGKRKKYDAEMAQVGAYKQDQKLP